MQGLTKDFGQKLHIISSLFCFAEISLEIMSQPIEGVSNLTTTKLLFHATNH